MYPEDSVFYFKRLNEDFNPLDLPDTYKKVFETEVKDDNRQTISKNLLSQLDIRLFGATFAPKGAGIKDKNISLHGSVQINHGVNVWHENNIFSEQIMSPFSNPNERKDGEDQAATTLGRQSKLQEGHYLHHFSINPNNLRDILALAGEEAKTISGDDISKLKDAMCKGVTYYDSAAKAGTDNELTIWIQLKEISKIVLPNINSLISHSEISKKDGKMVFDLAAVSDLVEKYKSDIDTYEVYYQKENTVIKNGPEQKKHFDLN